MTDNPPFDSDSDQQKKEEQRSGLEDRFRELELSRKAILNILEDTSEARDALVESEKRYRSVIENVSDIIIQHDIKGRFQFVNPIVERISGYSGKELLTLSFIDIIYEKDKTTIRTLFEEQFKKRTPEIDFETRIVTKRNEVRWLQVKSKLIGENNRITGWQSIARDITVRKQAKTRAQEFTRRLTALQLASQNLTSSLSFKKVAEKCAATANELIGTDSVVLFLFEPGGQILKPAVAVGYPESVMSLELKAGEGVSGMTVVTGKPGIYNRVDLTKIGKQVPGTPVEPESLMSVPLKTFNNVIGVLTVSRMGEWEFDQEDLIFLENLANISAAAINNARLYGSIRQSEEDFRLMVEKAVDPVITIDESSKVFLWNKAAEHALGYSVEEMSGNDISCIFPDSEGFKRYRQELSRFIRTGKSKTVGHTREFRAKHKNGKLIEFIVSVSAQHSEQGWKFTSIMKDISEAKKAQREIERLAYFPKENPLPVIEVNAKGELTYINPAGEKFISDQFDISQIDKILPPDYRKLATDSLKNNKDIQTTAVEVNNRVLLWTGHPISALELVHFYATDITELKRYEQELLKAKNQAEASDRLKNVFLSTISHEVRTPLNVILGYADLLYSELEEILSEDKRSFFDAIQESGTRLKQLIDDILDVSQIETDKVILKPETFAADDLVKKSVKEIMVSAAKKGIEVVENYNAAGAFITVDKIRVQQALGNILSNAVKFTHQGTISISTRIIDREYSVSIKDTGIGIRESFIPYLFTLFRQAEEGYNRSFEGAGLGLAISQRLVRAMGGRIKVKSKENKGTEFFIFLALTKKTKKVIVLEPQKTIAAKPVKVIDKKKEYKIFILEDNPANVNYMHYLLKKLELNHMYAYTGENGLKVLKDTKVDCMLIDISLAEGMSGVEFLKKVSNIETLKDIPKIAVTAHAMKGKKEEFLAEGFDDYLAKPFTLRDLEEVLSLNLK